MILLLLAAIVQGYDAVNIWPTKYDERCVKTVDGVTTTGDCCGNPGELECAFGYQRMFPKDSSECPDECNVMTGNSNYCTENPMARKFGCLPAGMARKLADEAKKNPRAASRDSAPMTVPEFTMENGTTVRETRCFCGGYSPDGNFGAYEDRHETHAQAGGKHCWGGCGGTPAEWHFINEEQEDEMQPVKRIVLWFYGGKDSRMLRVCLTWWNVPGEKCWGRDSDYQQHGRCELNIGQYEYLTYMKVWEHNGRFERLELTTYEDFNETSQNWACGRANGAGYVVENAYGKQLTGMFAQYGADIDQAGFWLAQPQCHLKEVLVNSISCATGEGSAVNTCQGKFDSDSSRGASVTFICDACDVDIEAGSEHTCGVEFHLMKTHTISKTSTDINHLGADVEVSYSEDWSIGIEGIASAGGSFGVGVSVDFFHEWQESETTEDTTTTDIASDCEIKLKNPGKESAEYTVLVADIEADFILDATEVYECPRTGEERTLDVQTRISNVATQTMVSGCTFHSRSCGEGFVPEQCQELLDREYAGRNDWPNREAWEEEFPDWFSVVGADLENSSKADFQKYYYCTYRYPDQCFNQGLEKPRAGCSRICSACSAQYSAPANVFASDLGCGTYNTCQECALNLNCGWSKSGMNCVARKDAAEGDILPYCGKTYAVLLESGKCADEGYDYIEDQKSCKKAAEELKLEYQITDSVVMKDVPQGCYMKFDTDVFFAMNTENMGRGTTATAKQICMTDYGSMGDSPRTSCMKENMVFQGKGLSLIAENPYACYKLCQMEDKKKCAGYTFRYTSKKEGNALNANCILYKKGSVKRAMLVATEQYHDQYYVTSAYRSCNPKKPYSVALE